MSMKLSYLFHLVVFSLVFPLVARAADFEGTLQWSFKAEITDPALKAEMAEGQREMADPAQLAEMKAMLEDPEMKAMMAQNPQMRAAIEAQVKMAEGAAGQSGDMITALMPKSMTLRAKDGRTHTQTEGGAMPMEFIGRTDPLETILINREARTFSKVPHDDAKDLTEKSDYRVTKTQKTTKILGYTCTQYLVEVTQDGQLMKGIFWATSDIPGLAASSLLNARVGGGEDAFMKEIDGVPLKMEMTLPQMKMMIEATSIRAGRVPDSVFEIPADFTETPFASGPLK